MLPYGRREAFQAPAPAAAVAELAAPESSLFLQTCEDPASSSEAVRATVEALKGRIEGADCASRWKRLLNTAELEGLLELDVSQTGLSSLAPLASLGKSRVADIAALAELSALQALRFAQTQISDVSVLRSLPRLRLVRADFSSIRDATPFADVRTLRLLSVDGIEDVTPGIVEKLSELEVVYAAESGLSDLGFVKALPRLAELYVSGNGTVDASPFTRVEGLQALDPSGHPIPRTPGTCPTESSVDPLTQFCTSEPVN